MSIEHMTRVKIVAAVLIAAGLAMAGVGFFYGVPTAQAGLDSAQAMYEDQAIELSYDEDGRFVDRGSVEQGAEILSLLEDDWEYPLDRKNLDPDDPLVNTRDELMVQYAIIYFHVKHGEVDVVLTQDDLNATGGSIEYRGVVYDEPGTYAIEVGKDYAELDRTHPIERQLRDGWSPLALSLNAYLSSGHANQAAGELARITSVGMGSVGLLFAGSGAGMLWIAAARRP